MSKISLQKALKTATRVAALHVEYMQSFYAEFLEIAQQLTAVDKALGVSGIYTASVDQSNFMETYLSHCSRLYDGEEEKLEAMSDDELYATKVVDVHVWNIKVDKKNNKFVFIWGDADSEDINDFDIENYDKETLPPNIVLCPLDDSGYQQIICLLAKDLASYLPLNIQLERSKMQDIQMGQSRLALE